MHVADVQDSVAVECLRQRGELLFVSLDRNAFRIPAGPPIESRQLQRRSNDRRRQGYVLEMKKSEPLTEDLRLMVPLDPQPLPGVKRSETFLQSVQNFFVHGMIAPRTGFDFSKPSIGLCS